MASTTNNRFASWKDLLLTHPLATPYDDHTDATTRAIRTTTTIQEATQLITGAQFHLAFLTTATGIRNECHIYHHCELHGSALIGSPTQRFALSGFGDQAHPVTVNTNTLFDVEDKLVPTLAYLKDLDTKEKVDADPPTQGAQAVPRELVALHSTILLPPWVTKVIEEAEATSFVEIFLAVREAAHNQDRILAAALTNDEEEAAEDDDDPTENRDAVLPILQALWYWNWAAKLANGHVRCDAACTPTQTAAARQWCRDIHSRFISAAADPNNPEAVTSTSAEAIALSHSIDNLTATYANGVANKESSSKKGTNKLTDKTKTMLLHAASTDGIIPATDLPPSLVNFLEKSTTANALEHLKDQLLDRKCICGISPGSSTAMHMGFYTWTERDVPNNFTGFALPYQKAGIIDILGLSVKAAEGKGLELADTKNLTKLTLTAPKNCNEARHMLNNMAAVAAELTSDSSLLTTRLLQWVEFANENESTLEELGLEDPTFFTKLIFLVDASKDQYLRHCRNGAIKRNLLDFEDYQQRILSRMFFITLPPVLQALTQSYTDSATPGNSNPNPSPKSQGKPRREPEGEPAPNRQGDKKIAVSPKEYKKIIHMNVVKGHVKAPKWNKDTQCCMRWHFKQMCHSKCPLAKTHGKPNTLARAELDRVYKECMRRSGKRYRDDTSDSENSDGQQGNEEGSE